MINWHHRFGAPGIRPRVVAEPKRQRPATLWRHLGPSLAGLLVVTVPSLAFGERWQIQPTASLKLAYDDNVRLTSVAPQGAFSANPSVAVKAIRTTENSDASLAFGFAGLRYAGLSALDSTNWSLGVDLAHRLERSEFRLSSQLVSQSTMMSESATTGLVQVNRQQTQFTLNPGWTYSLSERATLDLAVNYQDVSYKDVQALPLFNYRIGAADLTGTYLWSERLKLTGHLTYGRYDAQRINNAYQSVGIQAGAEYQISETASLAVLAGLRRTRQTFDSLTGLGLSNDSSGPIYVVKWTNQFEAGGRLSLEVRRTLEPSGSGQLMDTTGIFGHLSHRLGPRWMFVVDFVAYRNRTPGGRLNLSDRRYAGISPSISYELDESWRLLIGYYFRWQQRNDIPGDALSNAVFLTLVWGNPWDL